VERNRSGDSRREVVGGGVDVVERLVREAHESGSIPLGNAGSHGLQSVLLLLRGTKLLLKPGEDAIGIHFEAQDALDVGVHRGGRGAAVGDGEVLQVLDDGQEEIAKIERPLGLEVRGEERDAQARASKQSRGFR
jgi:hypothetical protein